MDEASEEMSILVGDRDRFAIESDVSRFFNSASQMALGFFVIHLRGNCYGVRASNATMLGCSFVAVERRIASRGNHTAPFAHEPKASRIVLAFRTVMYSIRNRMPDLFGLSPKEFTDLVISRELAWAPDGDEAFDDGSYVLQLDSGAMVRLIAFKGSANRSLHEPATLKDVWIEASEYYSILETWRDAFQREYSEAIASGNAIDLN